MKLFLKIFIVALIMVGVVVWHQYFYSSPNIPDKKYSDYGKYASEASEYCIQNGLNNDFFFLADLSVHSGKKRMYLVDFKKKEIVSRYMVSHGCGPYLWSWSMSKNNPVVSNKKNSHCSSVGKYIIEERGYSSWGLKIKYLLRGMNATNSNALSRNIVLHSWENISEKEVYPDGTPEGWGCPAVSNKSMREISKIIDASDKKVLLWIVK